MSISTDLFVVNIFCLVKDLNSKQFRPVVVSQSKSDFSTTREIHCHTNTSNPQGECHLYPLVPPPPLPLHLILDSFDTGGKG